MGATRAAAASRCLCATAPRKPLPDVRGTKFRARTLSACNPCFNGVERARNLSFHSAAAHEASVCAARHADSSNNDEEEAMARWASSWAASPSGRCRRRCQRCCLPRPSSPQPAGQPPVAAARPQTRPCRRHCPHPARRQWCGPPPAGSRRPARCARKGGFRQLSIAAPSPCQARAILRGALCTARAPDRWRAALRTYIQGVYI
jgi:hypothetical protein